MVDFVEPIDAKWVSVGAAAKARGVHSHTIIRWAYDYGLISYRELPLGEGNRSEGNKRRCLVRIDEVAAAQPPKPGGLAKLCERKKRPQGDLLTTDEIARRDEIQAIYKEAMPDCAFSLKQTPSGYYVLEIWENATQDRMVVAIPLSPGLEGAIEFDKELLDGDAQDWIGLTEAAELKEVSEATVYRWATHAALISHCRLPSDDADAKMVPILVRRSEIERLVPPPRGNPQKTGSRGNRPEGDPLTPNERQRLKEIEETYRKAKPDCVIDLRQYGSGYYAAEIFENATRKKMVVTLPLAPGEMVVS